MAVKGLIVQLSFGVEITPDHLPAKSSQGVKDHAPPFSSFMAKPRTQLKFINLIKHTQ